MYCYRPGDIKIHHVVMIDLKKPDGLVMMYDGMRMNLNLLNSEPPNFGYVLIAVDERIMIKQLRHTYYWMVLFYLHYLFQRPAVVLNRIL